MMFSITGCHFEGHCKGIFFKILPVTDGVVGFKGRFQVSGVQLVQDQLCVRNARFSRKLPLALKLDSSMQKFGPNFLYFVVHNNEIDYGETLAGTALI